jgi:radical SAM superfamily enzyme YgiQ (UPF0313 family)
MRFMDHIRADAVRYSILTPFPSTKLFSRLKRQGRIRDENWDHYDAHHVVFEPKQMSARALLGGFQRSLRHTYSVPAMLQRLWGLRANRRIVLGVNVGYFLQTRRLYGRHALAWRRLRPAFAQLRSAGRRGRT